jgi:hypothetical protein
LNVSNFKASTVSKGKAAMRLLLPKASISKTQHTYTLFLHLLFFVSAHSFVASKWIFPFNSKSKMQTSCVMQKKTKLNYVPFSCSSFLEMKVTIEEMEALADEMKSRAQSGIPFSGMSPT